jgi:uncharacterized delta-60 repeat protein
MSIYTDKLRVYDGTDWKVAGGVDKSGIDLDFQVDANGTVLTAAIQPDGKLVIGGSFTTVAGVTCNRIARLNADGTLDTGFDPGTGASGTVNKVDVLPSGAILIGGLFTTVNGITRNRFAALDADGTLRADYDFNFNNTVNDLAIQSDGAIIVVGAFTSASSTARNRIARFSSSGSLLAYNPDASGAVNAITLDSSGKAYVGGAFLTIGGAAAQRIARLNTDGTLDTAFDTSSGANSTVNAVAVDADGKALIGGFFTGYSSVDAQRIARLNTDGTLDTAFDTAIGSSTTIRSIVILPDGTIVTAADSTTSARYKEQYATTVRFLAPTGDRIEGPLFVASAASQRLILNGTDLYAVFSLNNFVRAFIDDYYTTSIIKFKV